MLAWQLTTWPKKYTFFSKLFFVSFVAHTLLLFFVFFLYRRDGAARHIDIAMHEGTVMFLPLQKTVVLPQSPTITACSTKKLTIVNAGSAADSPVKKSEHQKPQISKTRLVTAKKQAAQAPETQKTKSLPQKEATTGSEIAKGKPGPPAERSEAVVKQDVVYAGQLDREALELREKIRQEIECAWHPPVGIGTGKACKVRVIVDWQGRAQEIIFEESSAVLAFDNSVRHALLTMQFPKAAHGKELVMPFRA